MEIIPLSSEYGTYTTVKAIIWPGLSGQSDEYLEFFCSLFGRKRMGGSTALVTLNPQPSILSPQFSPLRPQSTTQFAECMVQCGDVVSTLCVRVG